MDPDPAIFVIDLQDAGKIIFYTIVSAYLLLLCLLLFEGTFTSFFKDIKVGIKVFLSIFARCWKYPVPDPYL
jgi:hypothetical protein